MLCAVVRDAMKNSDICPQTGRWRPIQPMYIAAMTIKPVPAIESVLVQMRAMSQAAALSPALPDTPMPQGGFASELLRSLNRVSSIQNHAARQSRNFTLGAPDVSLNDVMIDLQKAGLAFQAAIQVRNRLVSAYQEIASMPV